MFSDLKRIWAEQAFSKQIVGEFLSMLDSSAEMLEYALQVLRDRKEPQKSKKKIYKNDQSINISEQEIRKRILVHLSASPGTNLSASLVLMSITKDAERIGDLVKNIYELHPLLKNIEAIETHYELLFFETGDEVIQLIALVAAAFKESDAKKARQVSAKARVISEKCKQVISEVVESDYTAAQAVILTLGARYLTRIALHVSNVASSTYMPLPEMDYYDE